MSEKKKLLKEKANRLSEHYRNEVMSETTLELLPKEEFSNLIDVAKYTECGVWTAVESAFCMGYYKGECRYNIIKMICGIKNPDILDYINTIISDVAKEDTNGAKGGTEKECITELVERIDDVWILEQIRRFVVNITKEDDVADE